eukprot:362156-Chlamydomonas_euryale.AAC.5
MHIGDASRQPLGRRTAQYARATVATSVTVEHTESLARRAATARGGGRCGRPDPVGQRCPLLPGVDRHRHPTLQQVQHQPRAGLPGLGILADAIRVSQQPATIGRWRLRFR